MRWARRVWAAFARMPTDAPHIDPFSEKGLLYVTPEFLVHDDRHWLEHIAVEDLGDGWYVYEE